MSGELGVVMVDLDRTMFKGPLPRKTCSELIRGRRLTLSPLPLEDEDVGEFEQPNDWWEIAKSRFSVWAHEKRKPKVNAFEALRKALDGDQGLRAVVVTGREADKHEMTRRRIEELGYSELFSGYYLNPGRSATKWKGVVVGRIRREMEVKEVYLVDDDLRTGLVTASVIGEEGRVYILNNPFYWPPILRRSKVEIPVNLQFVDSVVEAFSEIGRRRSRIRI